MIVRVWPCVLVKHFNVELERTLEKESRVGGRREGDREGDIAIYKINQQGTKSKVPNNTFKAKQHSSLQITASFLSLSFPPTGITVLMLPATGKPGGEANIQARHFQ